MATNGKVMRLAAVFFALASICIAQGPSSPIASSGSVLIHVKDGYGGEIKLSAIKATITSQAGADFSPSYFSGMVHLPFGRYALRIDVPGFDTWKGELRVSRPLMRVTVGMPLGGLDGPRPTCALSGEIVGVGGRDAWVRLMPMFAEEILEADVSGDGHFQVDGAECGDYVLAVISGDKVLRSVYVRLKHEPNAVSIPLGPEQ